MIKGRGLLGNSLSIIDNDAYLFYANGISNSVLHQIPRNNFEVNEISEIAHKEEQRTFVYFSSCQVNSKFNIRRPYVQHKLFVEDLIKKRFSKYLIIRTSNLVGNNKWNTHTLFNYLFNSLQINKKIKVNPDVTRNILDSSHFVTLIQAYLDNYSVNKIIEIVNPVSFTMNQIIYEFEKYYLKKFAVERISEISDFAIFELNVELSRELFAICNIPTKDYLLNLLTKYYSKDKILSNC
jgi:nucleoside-diphosphate-sugar epimerase